MRSELVCDLTTLLHRFDPLKLVPMGAPADEYRSEAETIAQRVGEAHTAEDLERIAHEEFVAWFSPELAGPREHYRTFAREAWALI